MLAAMEGAMRASEIPTASHRCSSRRRCGPSALPALLTSVAMLTPLLCRIRWAERTLDPTRRMPPEFGHWCPRGPGADLPRTGATPPAHPPEPHSKPASRPPGLSVIPPFPAGYAQYLTFRPHIPRVPAARVKGRLEREVDRTPNFALDRERGLGSPWRVHETGASAGPNANRNVHPGSRLEFEFGVQGMPLGHASRVHAGERFGAGTRRPLRSTNRCDRRDIHVPCPGTPRYGIRVPSTPPSSRNLSTACSGQTMSESSQMSKVGISIDRMSPGSWPWTSPPSSSTLAIGVGRSSWFATILACSFRNP